MELNVTSYVNGKWIQEGEESELFSAVTGKPVATFTESDLDYAGICEYARETGGPKLRKMSIHRRAFIIKFLAKYLLERKEKYYELSTHTGATRRDSWIDIDGGIITAFGISSQSRRNLSDLPWHVEGKQVTLSRKGTFTGQHICVPRHGVAVHINAFNFPVWGMLEKLAPAFISGMPSIIKPSPTGAWLAYAVFRDMIESGLLPEGTVQFIAADKPGDLLDHLTSQDSVAFTGSAETGKKLKSHPNIIGSNVRFNLEADSLNACILGPDVTTEMPEFDLFIKEVVNEVTVKSGQKCTAIRRVIVPEAMTDTVIDALKERVEGTTVGDPSEKETKMGPLASSLQAERFREQLKELEDVTDTLYQQTVAENGAHAGTRLLYCRKPLAVDKVHRLEAFGPMTTVMPYSNRSEAVEIANRAGGSLVCSLFTADDQIAKEMAHGCAPHHGRFMIINRDCAGESTGHGSPIASLVHGGPGHAGGGEELGGARSVLHHMQRVALQGSPTTLMAVTGQHIKGAETKETKVHPFRKYFEELEIGESLTTEKHTITDQDITEFADLTGDQFYAHADDGTAEDSMFGERVAHGYLVLSITAGLFVHPDPGPVLLNYGLEDLRFTAPVKPGDTIRARLIVSRKTARQKRETDDQPYGMVWWDVEVTNQEGLLVAEYTILTLVKRKERLDMDRG
jgi:oxepin-CoA hydrolase/3-oxo-5,6-dehydrosuberyl-CoA semialdehyde dehydrogenase